MASTRRWATAMALAAGALAGGATVALVSRVLWAERQAIRPPALATRPGDRPAIMVFGAETLPTGPSRELACRLDHALRLYPTGLASVVVVSGGIVSTDTGTVLDEAADMAHWLVDHGVPASAVQLGLPGGNTRETVATMARLTREDGLHPWIAVTTPFHARRVRDEARRVGLTVLVTGPGDSPETVHRPTRRSRVLTEAVATAYYALPPAVTARVRTSAGTWRHSVPLRLAGRTS